MQQPEALAFLAAHQPMPPDDAIDEELIGQFDAAWRALRDHPHPQAADLLLNAFGDGSGFGVYQLVGDALRAQPRDQVVEALRDSLRSPHQGVRSWSAELAMEYPDPGIDAVMPSLLRSADRDERFFAACYLADRGVAVDPDLVAMAGVDADDELLVELATLVAGSDADARDTP